ncbi:MAG: tail fiber protein [Myxococcota bacterium]
MSEPFIGEIRMFAGNFAPRGWAFCDGQLLAVSQNDALFSLLGTIYGGDGRSTFALPDMRGRIPIHAGQGPGLSSRRLGARLGTENVTLTAAQIPSHSHTVLASAERATERMPVGQMLARGEEECYTGTVTPTASLRSNAVSATGGSQAHSNMQPFLALHFIIALVGIYPSRT